ncbi:MAG: murein biosynthesis integral membrane protein MurJ [Planctomycetota bacterium]
MATTDEARGSRGGGFVGHARVVAGLTLLSRVTGLVRDAVLAATLGAGTVSNAFLLGFMVPNLFRRLFGEGALSAAFVPAYVEARDEGEAVARALARRVLRRLTVLLVTITAVGCVVLALVWAQVGGAASDQAGLASGYSALLLPYMPMVCVVAVFGAILQVRGRFLPGSAAPLVLNGGMIAAAGLAWWLGWREQTQIAGWLIGGVLVAGLMQLAWLAWASRSGWLGGVGQTAEMSVSDERFRRMRRRMLPMAIGLAAFQLNAVLDGLIALCLSPSTDGPSEMSWFPLGGVAYPIAHEAFTWLTFAQRLYQFPLGVMGLAVATAIFPALARAAVGVKEGEPGDYLDTLRRGLRLSVFIGLPAAVGLMVVAEPAARVLFERGRFTEADTAAVGWLVVGYASGVWAYATSHVLTRAWYALGEAWVPMRVTLAMTAVNLAMNLVLIWPMGAAGLAWSTSITAGLQVVVLVVLLKRRMGGVVDGAVWRSWAWAAIGSGGVAAVAGGLRWWLGGGVGDAWWWSAAVLAVCAVAGGVTYVAVMAAGRRAELRWLLSRSAGEVNG